MAEWQTPKTDWTPPDGVADVDFNRIERNIKYLKEVNLAGEGERVEHGVLENVGLDVVPGTRKTVVIPFRSAFDVPPSVLISFRTAGNFGAINYLSVPYGGTTSTSFSISVESSVNQSVYINYLAISGNASPVRYL